jgi:hypothetical protein
MSVLYMSQVIFQIDPETEYQYHQLFQAHPEMRDFSLFGYHSIHNKPRIIRKIESFWDDEDRKYIRIIEQKWRHIEVDYFRLVSEITGTNWLYEDYYAYFLAFSKIIAFSNPYNFKSQEFILTTGALMNPQFLVGHELFHCHYYYLINKLKLTPNLNATVFTEGIAALTLSDLRMRCLFPETDFQSSIHYYPEVAKQWPIFQELWHSRSNFADFLQIVSQRLS